jgi:hypothetical protein
VEGVIKAVRAQYPSDETGAAISFEPVKRGLSIFSVRGRS